MTEVVRGQDLFHATAVHRLLQQLLGLPCRLPSPSSYSRPGWAETCEIHASTGLREFRAAGCDLTDIRHLVGLVLKLGRSISREIRLA